MKPEGAQRRTMLGDLTIIGRTEECGFVIDDSAASRRHAEIRRRANSFLLRDLGSTNGTSVNGSRIIEIDLRHGDEIRIGDTVLRFEKEEEQAARRAPEHSFIGTILAGDKELAVGGGAAQSKAEELFQAVYSFSNAVSTNYEPCSLADCIIETAVHAIHAQRGAVLFNEGDTLGGCPVCGLVHWIRDGKPARSEVSEVRISNTVAQRVIEGGESVLFQDVDADGELNVAESIVSLNLRSIICAPLKAKSGVLGILYIDTDRASHAYTEDDMLLASAVANSAGLAIENAQMAQELLVKQRIEQEIAFAWTIQEGFLVKEWPESDPRFRVYGETRPAKVVGGDFYDYVQPLEDHVGVLIGDVSGKGVPAALNMAQLLAQFRLFAKDESSPAKVLAALNEDLTKRTQRGMFCTMCYILLNLRTGLVRCANAGHHPAAILGASGVASRGEATGPPAGILPAAPWTDEEWTIAPGDMVLLYTDGVAEARPSQAVTGADGAIEDYGLEGIMRAAGQLDAREPRELIGAINEDVRVFCAPDAPHDDCTMIAVKYLGRA